MPSTGNIFTALFQKVKYGKALEWLVEGKYTGTAMSRSSGPLGGGSKFTKGQKFSFSGHR